MIKIDDSELLKIVKRVHEERIQNNYYNPIPDDKDEFEEDVDLDNISFGDLMLDAAKSEDEAILQMANDFIDIVYKEAEKDYRNGKYGLFNELKNEGYTLEDDQKKVVIYESYHPFITNERIGSNFRWQIQRLMEFCKIEYNNDYSKLTVTPINQEVFDIYMYWLSRLSEKDNIKISFCFSHSKEEINKSNTYTIPCIFYLKKGEQHYHHNMTYLRFEFTLPDSHSVEYQKKADEERKNKVTNEEIEEILYKSDFYSIFEKIDEMDGYTFESFCAKLLRSNGYSDVSVTSGSRDQGIDIIAYKDKIKYGIQCKCYSTDVGNSAVQEANAGRMFYNCNVGVVLTNRFFTISATDLAESIGIVLWDRDFLKTMIEDKKE